MLKINKGYKNVFGENHTQNLIVIPQENCNKTWRIISALLRKNNQSNSDTIIIDDEFTSHPQTI